ncbi:MAG: cytidine deaminase [Oscillospiraceae bacterium]
MDKKALIQAAFEARQYSYSPYSGFAVGAAILCENGQIITGCNIESASYTPTICAERTAFSKAVSTGITKFIAIAIVGGKVENRIGEVDFCAPCGVCRQVMMEFCDPKTFQVILAKDTQTHEEFTLDALLPRGFGPLNLV